MPFGFININKPKGITSFDVIYKLRKILGIKKIGHAGTLDPLAQGVLPVAVGDAARLIEYLKDDKEYLAEIKFGQSSSTYDEEGEKTPYKEPNFTKEELISAVDAFKGDILQKPPIYSAIKIGGKKLYEIARKGKETPEIPAREVCIYNIELIEFKMPFVKLKVHCSKGTYIRSIANDLGEKLGCGAYLSSLIRTRAGDFCLEDSIEIEQASREILVNPLNVFNFPSLVLTEGELFKVKNGNSIMNTDGISNGEACDKRGNEKILLIHSGKLVAIGHLSANIIKVEKVFGKG